MRRHIMHLNQINLNPNISSDSYKNVMAPFPSKEDLKSKLN